MVREAVLARVFVYLRRETEPCYDILVDLTAVDHLERQSPARFAIYYRLRSAPTGAFLRLEVFCGGQSLPSAVRELSSRPCRGCRREPHRLADRAFVGGDVATPEGMVHHFSAWMDGHGLQSPSGDVYLGVEAPGGELGLYLVSDGTDRPYRLRFRTPSFAHVQCYPELVSGLDLDEAPPLPYRIRRPMCMSVMGCLWL